VRHNQQREDGDHEQRGDVSECEERGKNRPTERLIDEVAAVTAGVADTADRVGAEDGNVDEQHAGPDGPERNDDARALTKPGSACVVDDRHVAYDCY